MTKMSRVTSIQAPETVMLRVITGAGLKDANSPILLFGDSHTLVFDSGGEMHAVASA